MRTTLRALALTAALAPAVHAQTAAPVEVPARFVAGRVMVDVVTASGDTLRFFTDTGGGTAMLHPDVVARLGLAVDSVRMDGEANPLVDVPPLPAGSPFPLPGGPFPGRLLVSPPTPTIHDGYHGMLGRVWFAERAWTFDYPAGRLFLRAPGDLPPHDAAHRVPLGFKVNRAGQRTTHFPRIRIEVDGDSLDLLYDSGASLGMTDSAHAALADGGPAIRGTSFIVAQVFDGWRARHPDWRVIERAERGTGAAIIEVPRVSIGGYEVGPVWFTRRPDRNFHEYMSQWMDRRIDGALGGSALGYFRVTVDYPNAVAVFERP
ncbi:hypothetical protein [Longimicrobium sp.]|uniref:hypothetical protein n=1 Tax=Longimicrobium sp. TaxID=2029185 RepID=UPI002E2EB4F0|nr:hypothetical protein [Longimicrobium sp.]HEX6036809.1 hypothetical protein [Longimicrobium sp.]